MLAEDMASLDDGIHGQIELPHYAPALKKKLETKSIHCVSREISRKTGLDTRLTSNVACRLRSI